MTIKKLFELVKEEEARRERVEMERGYPLTNILIERGEVYKMDFEDVVLLFKECLYCLIDELNEEGEIKLMDNIKYWYESKFQD